MNEKLSFLSQCTSGGCGAKIGPGELAQALAKLPVKNDPALLVGFEGRDDAAVYKINDEQALVSTIDFFSPMVDDPFLFGKIAAANALSDIYAMGAKPLFALNLICIPQKMERTIIADILAGGAAKIMEADAVLAGGHSIYDHEPKYGLAVSGIVDPARILKNNTCAAGDILILTKALGIGLCMAAYREDLDSGSSCSSAAGFKAATDSMERLNRYAAEKFSMFSGAVHACTDVTGFGLAVHASEMAGVSHSIQIDSASLPLLPDALCAAENDYTTSAGNRNRNYMQGKIEMAGLSDALQELVFDPQTSGGLLLSVPADEGDNLLAALRAEIPDAAIIGSVKEKSTSPVQII